MTPGAPPVTMNPYLDTYSSPLLLYAPIEVYNFLFFEFLCWFAWPPFLAPYAPLLSPPVAAPPASSVTTYCPADPAGACGSMVPCVDEPCL